MAKQNAQDYWLNIKKEAQAMRQNLVSMKNTKLESTGSSSEAQPSQGSSLSIAGPTLQPAQSNVQTAQRNVHTAQSNVQSLQLKSQPIHIKVPSQSMALATQSNMQATLKRAQAKPAFDMFDEDKRFYEESQTAEDETTELNSGKGIVNNWTTVSTAVNQKANPKPGRKKKNANKTGIPGLPPISIGMTDFNSTARLSRSESVTASPDTPTDTLTKAKEPQTNSPSMPHEIIREPKPSRQTDKTPLLGPPRATGKPEGEPEAKMAPIRKRRRPNKAKRARARAAITAQIEAESNAADKISVSDNSTSSDSKNVKLFPAAAAFDSNYAEKASPANYEMVIFFTPKKKMSKEDGKEIQVSVSKYIQGLSKLKGVASEDPVPQFHGPPIVIDGEFHVQCSNEFTVGWLSDTIPKLDIPWTDYKLAIKRPISRRMRAVLPLPPFCTDLDIILPVLLYVNPWSKINTWSLIQMIIKKEIMFLTFDIPEDVIPEIIKRHRKFVYGLGSVLIKFIYNLAAYPLPPIPCPDLMTLPANSTQRLPEETPKLSNRELLSEMECETSHEVEPVRPHDVFLSQDGRGAKPQPKIPVVTPGPAPHIYLVHKENNKRSESMKEKTLPYRSNLITIPETKQPGSVPTTRPAVSAAPGVKLMGPNQKQWPSAGPRQYPSDLIVNPEAIQPGSVRTTRSAVSAAPGVKLMGPSQTLWPSGGTRQYPCGIPRSFLVNQPEYQQMSIPEATPEYTRASSSDVTSQLSVQTDVDDVKEQYSPSDAYADTSLVVDQDESSETSASGQKRLSAFDRLGPVTQPKKPKLTINLTCSKDTSVREVVDLTETKPEKYKDVSLRDEVVNSTNEIVKKFLPSWPWHKNIQFRKTATDRASKSAMMLQLEHMDELYQRDTTSMFCISVIGYPPHWNKEDVLDAILDGIKGKPLIPLYIDFKLKQCRFLVTKSRAALVAIHKVGFYIRKDDVELKLSICQTDFICNNLSLQPKIELKSMLDKNYDGERKLSLKEFTVGSDISNFVYFPLSCLTNQIEILELGSEVIWEYITDLDLSGNRLTSLDGFDLPKTTPRLKNLDVSNNRFDKLTLFCNYKALTLRSIVLEGNPLCTDYTDPSYYVKVLRMIFPTLKEIDGIPIRLSGDIPKARRNYCLPEAKGLVDMFLDVFFSLLESDDRKCMAEIYAENAVLSITFRSTLRSSDTYIYARNLFNQARCLKEGDLDCIEGASDIARHISKWPPLVHDPYSFTVDVMHHDDSFTIIRVGGLMKLTSESLADDEHMIAFTRTLVLHTNNGYEYKIHNEMVYWDAPSKEWGSKAFQINTVKRRRVSLHLDFVPDEELQKNLVEIFMKITDLDEKASYKCLEVKDWNFKEALQHFIKILKLDGVECLKT